MRRLYQLWRTAWASAPDIRQKLANYRGAGFSKIQQRMTRTGKIAQHILLST
jgi:hypothetical protein